ncbi:MAG: response regulator [Bacteroidota bacterium]
MKQILIIDDDSDMCKLLGNFLQRKGFDAVTSQTGHKGIEKFKENFFDVVLCDFRLGDMDGRKVLQEIKAIKPGVVFIFITGYSDLRMAVEVIKNGAFDYITKPLIPEEVINVINSGLAELNASNEHGSATNSTVESRLKNIILQIMKNFLLVLRRKQLNCISKLNWWRLPITV